ncbi:hypothetical protein TI39_contig4111g00007 [Zymoseptoria brevis]|uniref:F-box domain-containing protein n=1 Tax=Zymoseptoria brevis TaxID=1047168 RepID=A0A0F4GH01_9PEZI|nr:hypothetical protein TI39_contig4111g00007 [Zymoseptoria brevis]
MKSTNEEGGASEQDFQCKDTTGKESHDEHPAKGSSISEDLVGDIAVPQLDQATPLSVAAVDWSNSAVHQVLETVELCESILSNLSPIDLLRVRQLSPLFATVISNSQLLKCIAFLSPAREGAADDPVVRDPVYVYFAEPNSVDCRACDAPTIIHPVDRNPFVFGGVNTSWCTGALGFSGKFADYVMNNISFPTIQEMYLTNPPVNKMGITLGEWEMYDPGDGHGACAWFARMDASERMGWCFHAAVGEIRRKEGLKVKDLVEFLHRKLSMADADGERRFTLEDSMVILPAPLEVVGNATDTSLPGKGKMTYGWMM